MLQIGWFGKKTFCFLNTGMLPIDQLRYKWFGDIFCIKLFLDDKLVNLVNPQ